MNTLTLGDALFTKTQQRVLALFFGKPDARFYTNDIMRRIAMGRGTVLRELGKLVQVGILLQTKEGNQNYYQANLHASIYHDLLNIVRKTFGVAEVLRSALQTLDVPLELAFIYGSIARNADDQNSDIDLMLVGDGLSYSDIMSGLLPLEAELMRPINPTIYRLDEFHQKRERGSSFLSRVMEQPKIWLKGSDDDISQPGQSG